MGSTPEEFPGQGPLEAEPFSPSVFLDLPPTPSEEDAADSTDDLALPFISRMLMEDIDDKFFYHYHDHPALLQAQQPYAQILSDAASAAADSFTTNTNGSGACTLTPSPDAPAFANAAWPYDPVELSQQLLSSPRRGMGAGIDDFTADGGNQLLLPQQDARNHSAEFLDGAEETTTTTTWELDAVSSTFFSGRSRVDMDMLNQAFHRGMEEAKKFLPIDNNNILLSSLEAVVICRKPVPQTI
ncbi:unnamed protein product [Miscanthus lutarioriparius]|uniref:Uncharacterized protein n=1 Tax=Miscanthus lutarioriparius TaxID=422564 RepID=A0A811NJK9_9POAL|nr:unnamed protein product [Miscanthus lutarioriparius]